ncbi:MAG: threonine-phosphate decarboxylase, partial [Clostridia bacterium]|nr:threonine-phosphate decarboxylase [Clostridia bacterium]
MTKNYHGGNLKEGARLYGLREVELLDFSANINPLGPSPQVWTALQKALPRIIHYPDPEARELKEVLASYLGVPAGQVVLGNGGAELIYLLSRFFRPGRVVLTAPTFGEYGGGAPGVEILPLNLAPERDFRLTLEQFAGSLKPGDLVFVGNPNNPTGVLTPRETVLELAQLAAAAGSQLVVDEAFMDFVEESQSVVSLAGAHPNLIVVGSLTKIFALPGLRLGYLVAREELVSQLEDLLPPWRVNTLAQAAGLVSLRDQEHLRRSREVVKEEREYLIEQLKDLGFRPFPGRANFLLVSTHSVGVTGAKLQSFLGPRGVLIRLCHSFANLDDYYFRIAVRTREENEKLLGLLEEALAASSSPAQGRRDGK